MVDRGIIIRWCGRMLVESSWVMTCCCIVFLGETFWSHLLSPYVYFGKFSTIVRLLCAAQRWVNQGFYAKECLNTEREAEVFSLPITNPNRRPMLPFDWLIHSSLILAKRHRILFLCRFLRLRNKFEN